MDMGIGLSETLLILLVILLFFGSKQLPKILKDFGHFSSMAKIKLNDFLAEIRQTVEEEKKPTIDWVSEKKAALRKNMLALRRSQSLEELQKKSKQIAQNLMESVVWKEAGLILIYLSMPDEVQTDNLIKAAFLENKRVIIPYTQENSGDLKISELKSLEEDLQKGRFGIREPKNDKIRRFFKSDLDLVICPGVAFDRHAGRLGFGKGYFDNFLKELRGMIPVVGFAFDFQILQEPLPFSYNDIPMDMVFTESEIISAPK